MTTIPALVADKATDALQYALSALKKATTLYSCGFNVAHARSCLNGRDETGCTADEYESAADDIRTQIATAIEHVRASIAAVPASEPVKGYALVPLIPNREMQAVMDDEGWQWEDLLAAAEAITEEQYAEIAAAHAPVSGMPDLAKLARYDPTAMEEMFGCGDGEYVRLADVEALFAAPQAPDTPTKQG